MPNGVIVSINHDTISIKPVSVTRSTNGSGGFLTGLLSGIVVSPKQSALDFEASFIVGSAPGLKRSFHGE